MPVVFLNKPCRVLSQFRDDHQRPTLRHYIETPSVYPAGRLDFDSEGLLLLTDDGALQARISQPKYKLLKHYWVQVEGVLNGANLSPLLHGVELKDGPAFALKAEPIAEPDSLWSRNPPIRVRRNIPTSWIDIAIDAGRNRQVRRMTAAIGFPTLRLIRYRIGPWSIGDLLPGESLSINSKTAWNRLNRYLDDITD